MNLDETTTSMSDDLAPGEQVLAQVMVRPDHRPDDHRPNDHGPHGRRDLSQAAAAFSHDRLLVAVTDGRLVGWRLGRLGNRPVACVASVPIALVVDARIDRHEAGDALVLEFSDESSVRFEVAPRATDVKRFLAAVRNGLPVAALAG